MMAVDGDGGSPLFAHMFANTNTDAWCGEWGALVSKVVKVVPRETTEGAKTGGDPGTH